MKKAKNRFFFLLFSLIFGLLLSCTSSPPPSPQAGILVSAAPYAYFVQKIVQDKIPIEVLVPPEANPHAYEPTPKKMESILQTSLWFRLGEPSENKIVRILQEKNPNYLFIDLSQTVPLLQESTPCCSGHSHGHEEERDRHFWMSPKIAQEQVLLLNKTLTTQFPKWKDLFQENTQNLLQELEELDQKTKEELLPFKNTAIVVSHPAFGYFCHEYNLRQLSIETEGKDPLPQDIDKIFTESKSLSISCVLVQLQYNNKGAYLLAEKLHLPAFEIDPYSRNYPEMITFLTSCITHSQTKRPLVWKK